MTQKKTATSIALEEDFKHPERSYHLLYKPPIKCSCKRHRLWSVVKPELSGLFVVVCISALSYDYFDWRVLGVGGKPTPVDARCLQSFFFFFFLR